MLPTIVTVSPLCPPAEGNVWIGLSPDALPQVAASTWVVRPSCGATVVFTGTARDHSVEHDGVTALEYEAWDEQVLVRLQTIADEARTRWPTLGAVALLHRTGVVALGEPAVVVAVSAPHRGECFDAARWCIDTLKHGVPIWKRETWAGGSEWVLDGAAPIDSIDASATRVPEPAEPAAR